MKAFVFGAVGALALLAAAPANAASGYVGAAYTRDQVNAKPKDVNQDIFGVEGAVAFNASESLGLDLDAAYADSDDTDSTTAGAAHLYLKGAGYKFGGFAGVADAGNDTIWSAGLEGQRNFGQTTLAGAVGYANDDDANADAWGADAELRYFATDNFRLAGKLSYANISPDKGKDDNLVGIGVNAEYQLATTPVSFRAGYEHTEFDKANVDSDAFTVGIRYNWGGSLKDRDENGPSFAGLSSLTGAF